VRLRAAVFDFGETLLSEERAWGVWADWIGVTHQELFAAIARTGVASTPTMASGKHISVTRSFEI